LFRDAAEIRAEVLGETQRAIENLALIKLGSQIGVALIGGIAGIAFVGAAVGGGSTAGAGLSILGLQAGGTAGGFEMVGLANSVATSVIKHWEGGVSAQVSGVSLEGVKASASHFSGDLALHSLDKAREGSVRAQHIIESAKGEIRKQSKRLAEEGLRKKSALKATNILTRARGQVAAQTAAMERFGKTAMYSTRVARIIPVVFAAWDIWDAVDDYRETIKVNH
jgi:hypothetical protein